MKWLASLVNEVLRWDAYLDFGLDIFDGVGSFHLKSDCLTRQGFDENLHFRSRFTVLNRVKMRKLVTFREKVILEKDGKESPRKSSLSSAV